MFFYIDNVLKFIFLRKIYTYLYINVIYIIYIITIEKKFQNFFLREKEKVQQALDGCFVENKKQKPHVFMLSLNTTICNCSLYQI